MKIGLVLSGGMAKGAFQIGALEAINEYFSFGEIEFISAASIGAINAFAYATQQLDYARESWVTLSEQKSGLLHKLTKSEDLQKVIVNLSEKPISDSIRTLYIPLFNLKYKQFSYVDLKNISAEDMSKYLAASIAFPMLGKPVEIDGLNYYDGALVDNIPVAPLGEKDLDFIICIYFDNYNYVFETNEFDGKVIKITFDDTTFESIVVKKEKILSMIDKGYQTAKKILGFVFEQKDTTPEKIYERISLLNKINAGAKIRVTGDVVFNNLTKIIKKYGVRNIEK